MSTISELKTSITFGGGLARPNNFLITLPSLGGGRGGILGAITGALGARNQNILCRTASLPGKQILTHERRIGMEFEKIAYGYAVDDVTLTFMETATYPIRKYFDEWRKLIIDEDGQTAGYKSEYQKRIIIHQLGSPIPLPTMRIPFLNVGISTYSVELINAFPTTINSIEFNNDQDSFVETSVQLSYTNWKQVPAGQLSLSFNF
jgi:hypothetical protein